MSELIKQIKIGETTYEVGTKAENVSYNDTTTVKKQIENNVNNISALNSNKANNSDVYNKTTIDTKLTNKADKSNTYTKSEVDALINAGGGSGGGGVAATDAVIENSLTVNGYVVEGEGHKTTFNNNVTIIQPMSEVSLTSTKLICDTYNGTIPLYDGAIGVQYQAEGSDFATDSNLQYIWTNYLSEGRVYIAKATVYGNSSKSYNNIELTFTGSFNGSSTPIMKINVPIDESNINTGVLSIQIEKVILTGYLSSKTVEEPINLTASHIQGKYSDLNEESIKYAHVVGGGTSEDDRKNIHTLDWDGNAYFAGDISLSREEKVEKSWNLGDAIAYINDCPFDISTTLLEEPLILDKTYSYYWNSGRMASPDYAAVESMKADCFYRGTLSGATSTPVECVFKFIHNEQRIEGYMLENYYASNTACTKVTLQARDYWSEKIITPGMNISSLIDVIIDLQSRIAALEAK